MIKVTVFGASGLVGRVLVERLSLDESYAVRAVIHSSGNAWGLARSRNDLVTASLSSKKQIARAIEGSTHVVNCSLPRDAIGTLHNLLDVCSEHKIQRLVHISSIAVYGDQPSPESIYETAVPKVKKFSYGWVKMRQDELVAKAHRKGLSCAILCPANITGIRSRYLLKLVSALREGRIALVDGGERTFCSTDVINLCSAIELALKASEVDGQRMYINDGSGQTWRDLIDGLMELTDGHQAPCSISEEEAREIIARQPAETVPLSKILKGIVANREIRDQIRKNPFVGRLYRNIRSSSEYLPAKQQTWLLRSMDGRFRAIPFGANSPFDAKFCMHQLRNVVPSIQRAQGKLGYAPPLSFSQSMEMFRSWYKQAHGYGDETWAMLRMLYPHA